MTVPEAGGEAAGARGRRRLLRFTVIALAVATLLGFAIARATRYVRHEERFCTGHCHTPRQGTSSFRPHGRSELECQACHVTGDGTAISLLVRKAVGAKEVPAHAKIDGDRCVACHERDPVAFRRVLATDGHREHRKVDCLGCHGKNTHDPDPITEKLCLACHEPARLHKTVRDAETCLSCHPYNVRLSSTHVNLAMSCEGCHSGARRAKPARPGGTKVVDDGTVHGALPCKLCHEPHGKTPPPDPRGGASPGSAQCARCHQAALLNEGDAAPREEHRRCEGCHEPHAPRKAALGSCARCHEPRGKAPPAASGPRHHGSCASCHLPHDWRADRAGCVACHADQATSLREKSPPAHDGCGKCHETHGPPATAAVCEKCHEGSKRAHAGAPEKHRACTSCHAPHAATVVAARATCGACHEGARAQLATGAPQHAEKGCGACHQAHGAPAPRRDLCDKCHGAQAKAVAAAEPGKHRDCAGCHAPHGFRVARFEAACDRCHAGVVPSAEAVTTHKGPCRDCHAAHGTARVGRAGCAGCHEPVKAKLEPQRTHEKHRRCGSCHTPHQAAAAAGTECKKCHAAQAKASAAWPAGTDHEKGCGPCHQGHDPRATKACATCHAKEEATSAGGKHRCAQCHPPHQAPPAPKKGPSAGAKLAWWTGCNRCHRPEVAGVKEAGPQHSECKSCHEPHAPRPVACASCHAKVAARSGHATRGHTDSCTACHDPHVKGDPPKARCLSCHGKQRQHEPDAASCHPCHAFK